MLRIRIRCGPAALACCAANASAFARSAPRAGFDPQAGPSDMRRPRRSEVIEIMVEVRGIEPLTSGLQSPRSPS